MRNRKPRGVNRMRPQKKHWVFRRECADCRVELVTQAHGGEAGALFLSDRLSKALLCSPCADRAKEKVSAANYVPDGLAEAVVPSGFTSRTEPSVIVPTLLAGGGAPGKDLAPGTEVHTYCSGFTPNEMQEKAFGLSEDSARPQASVSVCSVSHECAHDGPHVREEAA